MCPLCFATVGYVAAGAVSAGGLTALAVKISRRKNTGNETVADVTERRAQDVDQHDQ